MIAVRPQQRSALNVRAVGDEMVVLDRAANQVHQLNVTAAFVWQRCDGQHTVAEITGELVAAFEVDLATATSAVDTTLARFDALGLLAPEPT